MLKKVIIAVFVFSMLFASGQNIVPNGDFSQMKNLPTAANYRIDTVFQYWYCPNGISPMPVTSLATDIAFTAKPMHPPMNYPHPFIGDSYVIFGTWFQLTMNENRRTYLSTPLTQAVQNNKWYRLSLNFFNSQPGFSTQYSNNFGVAFTDSLMFNHHSVISMIPDFNIDTPVTISNEWLKLDTCFIATKSAGYMTIGNFFNDANTTVNPNSSSMAGFGVDNIYLEPLELTLSSGDTVFGCSRESLVLEATKDCWYKWARKSNPTNILHEGPRFEVYPRISESYLVYGLTDTLEVFVQVDDRIGTDLGGKQFLCEGDSVVLDLSHLQADRIVWSTGEMVSSIVVKTPGDVYVQVERGHCTEIDTVHIIAETIPNHSIGSDKDFVCLGDRVQLTIPHFLGQQYAWSTGESTASIEVADSKLYWVDVSNYCGTGRDSIEIYVEPCTCTVYLPTAFRPASSVDRNTHFGPIGDCVYTDYEFRVFNRWGALVFESRDPQNFWNGRQANGTAFPMGTYIYTFTYSGFNEVGSQTQETRRGSITIIN